MLYNATKQIRLLGSRYQSYIERAFMTNQLKIKLAAPQKYYARHSIEAYASLPFRTDFERDRDRILYSKEFRRLSGKTQVFLSQSHDHIRTRLTHTLEVAQISRVVASNLNLGSVLSEAIAYGHDVGHTPFGHVGERTLSLIMNNCDQLAEFQKNMENTDKGFKHNLQSLRVTCDLEQTYGRRGLNLTNFTLWGIRNHSSSMWKSCIHKDKTSCKCHLKRSPVHCEERGEFKLNFYDHYNSWLNLRNHDTPAWSFEGLGVAVADEIAQRHHDIEDALFVGIITHEELVEKLKKLLDPFFDRDDKLLFEDLKNSVGRDNLFLQRVSKFIVNFLTKNLIRTSLKNLIRFINRYNISSRRGFEKLYPIIKYDDLTDIISYEAELVKTDKKLQTFLRDRILNSFEVQRMDGKGNYIIRGLFKAYLTNPRQLHDSTIYYVFRQFEPDKNKEWADISKEDLGKMRNRMDTASLKSDDRFQICLLRGICDHLAGMTDGFATQEHKNLYG